MKDDVERRYEATSVTYLGGTPYAFRPGFPKFENPETGRFSKKNREAIKHELGNRRGDQGFR